MGILLRGARCHRLGFARAVRDRGSLPCRSPPPIGIVDLRDQETGKIGAFAPRTRRGAQRGGVQLRRLDAAPPRGADGLLKIWDLSSDNVIRSVRGPGGARGPDVQRGWVPGRGRFQPARRRCRGGEGLGPDHGSGPDVPSSAVRERRRAQPQDRCTSSSRSEATGAETTSE